MNLILLGPPGAGKGTQADLLRKRFGWLHISTGDILRRALRMGNPIARQAQTQMDRGELVSDEVVLSLVESRLKEPDAAGGYILDGFPRTSAQAQGLEAALHRLGKQIDMVLYLDISAPMVLSRLLGRRVCPNCEANFHVVNRPSVDDKRCDRCGTLLVQRDDDQPETVQRRLKIYNEQTEGLIDYYRSRELLIRIIADRPIDSLHEDIASIFHQRKLA